MGDLRDQIEKVLLKGAHSTPELVAEVVREAIIGGVFADGAALRQDELAAQLGLSKIPVREALRRLEAEGLVVFYPNRGAVVASVSVAEAREISEMRVALETLALRRAIPALAARDLRSAAAILDEIDHETDAARWSRLNWDFHATLYSPAQRPRLLSTIQTLHRSVDRYLRIVLASIQHQSQSQREHRALLAACERREPVEATALLAQHIEAATALLETYLSQVAAAERPNSS